MRTRTTIILAVALILASVFAWIDTPSTPSPFSGDGIGGASRPDQPPGEGIIRLLSFSTDSVTRITLQRGALNTTLTRSEGRWSGIADSGTVDEFLRSMQELAQIIVVGSEEGGPSDYGLAPPVARVTLERSADDAIDLRIGNANPTSTGLYAQVGAHGPVVLTGALALWDLDKVVRVIASTSTPALPTSPAKEAQP